MEEAAGDGSLISEFKKKFGFKSDEDVAFVLDVSRSQVTDWKNKHRPMPWGIRFRMLDHLGYAYARDLVTKFLSPEEHEKLIEIDCMRMKRWAEERKEKKRKKAEKRGDQENHG